MNNTKVDYPIWPKTKAEQDVWDGQSAGALCGECTALEDLTPEQRANPDFMRGYNETGHRFWVGDV